jgi:hypothetical protein
MLYRVGEMTKSSEFFLINRRLLSLVAASGLVALQGCGGGGGGGAPASDSPVAQQDRALQVQASEPVASAGFTVPAGTLISGSASAALWTFSSSNTMPYTPGSVAVGGDGAVRLNFDFGCQTSTIVVRQTDCRNSVSVRRTFSPNVSVPANAVLSLDLRNADASANFAVMVTDQTGQMLRYPISMRSIEGTDPSVKQRAYVALSSPSSWWSGSNDGVVHGPITAIAISAQPFINDFASGGLNYPAGMLEIGDIRLHSVASFDYTLQTNASRPSKTFVGSYKGRLSVATDSLAPAYLDKAVQAGIYTVRRDFNWAGTEQSAGQYNFTYYLNSMPDLLQRDMKVHWILDYGNVLHGGANAGDTPLNATDRQAYADFAGAVATAFRGKPVFAYELWNEPDSSIYWRSPDAVAYSDMVRRATTKIKTADSSAKVVTGGVVLNQDTSYLLKLAGQTTNLNQVDAIGLHPYRYDTFIYTSPTYKRVSNTPESYAADQAMLSNLLAAGGVSKPLWNTESGYSSWQFLDSTRYGDGHDARARNRQGVLTLRKVLTELALDAPLITLYSLYDAGTVATDKEMNFGLLGSDLSEKPAFVALKNLFSSVGQLTFKGYHTDVPPHTHAMRWDSATTNRRVFVLWVDSPDFTSTITLPAGVTAVKSWTGATIVPTTSGGVSRITLTESEAVANGGPVFVFVN